MDAPDECEELAVALSAYADGELRCEQLRWRVSLHLRGCFACQQTLLDYARLDEIMRDQPPLEVPPELKDRLAAVLKTWLLSQ